MNIAAGRFANCVRPLTPAERARLHESLAHFGQRSPITVDEDGTILDGHHRFEWLVANGIEPELVVVDDLAGDDDKRALAVSLNEDRRQLTREELRERHRELRAEGKSLRAIAGETGVHHDTVARDVAGVGNPTPALAKVTGADGKAYPARRQKPEVAVEREPACDALPDSTPRVLDRDDEASAEDIARALKKTDRAMRALAAMNFVEFRLAAEHAEPNDLVNAWSKAKLVAGCIAKELPAIMRQRGI